MTKRRLVGVFVSVVLLYTASSTAMDYVASTLPSRPPRLYLTVSPTVVTLPVPSIETVFLVFAGWLLGVAYGIYLFERHNKNRSLTDLFRQKLNHE
ncbi:hypothetical protein [Natronomonas amylolytica]|uniref:hypothetical protein n=1 Tax=Natronomonas amylolytica TaxID=3108498 RepID=UPI00300B659A